MSVPDAKRLKDLEAENTRLKKLLAEQVFENGAPHEAVAIEVERVISGQGVASVLDRLSVERGLPQVITTDNGKEFCGKARVAWAHEKEIALRLIEPGKPKQPAHRLGVADTGASSFDDANRQLTHNGRTLSYDDNGNLTSDGVRSYVWNVRNQLVEIREGASTLATFGYDPLGRRVVRTEGSTTTHYLYDGQNAVNDSGGRAYYLTDHLGSTRGLTNGAGELLQRYDYTPYGQLQASAGSATNPYRYTGREQDESGLYYYRARYYSPDMGRFISEDSYGFASGDVNFYAYALGNPISYSDPSGHIAWFALLPLIWAGVEIALSIHDAIDTGRILMDPCATSEQKTAAASLFVVGVFMPGAGMVSDPGSSQVSRCMEIRSSAPFVGLGSCQRKPRQIPAVARVPRGDQSAALKRKTDPRAGQFSSTH